MIDFKKREHKKSEDIRGHYFRDSTAIIHSEAFRRLKHKTQVFFSPSNDHICTRIDHVLHVASIAQTLCKSFKYDEELAFAIGLGHDLGHAPFGHVGEVIINGISKDLIGKSFHHEMHSLRVVDFIENDGAGLNLTYAVRDGIVTHCGERFEKTIRVREEEEDLSKCFSKNSLSWEGLSVKVSDQVAYMGRDLEDALRLNIITTDDIPSKVKKTLGVNNSSIINTLVNDLIENSDKDKISFSDKIYDVVKILIKFNYQAIYKCSYLNDYLKYFHNILNDLKVYLLNQCDERRDDSVLARRFSKRYDLMIEKYKERGEGKEELIIDYLAGMSDNYAISCAKELYFPSSLDKKLFGFTSLY